MNIHYYFLEVSSRESSNLVSHISSEPLLAQHLFLLIEIQYSQETVYCYNLKVQSSSNLFLKPINFSLALSVILF